MARYLPFSIRALIAIVLLAGSFAAGMSVSNLKTAAIMRQLATELGQAQQRIKELEGHDHGVKISAEDLDAGKVAVIGRLGSPPRNDADHSRNMGAISNGKGFWIGLSRHAGQWQSVR